MDWRLHWLEAEGDLALWRETLAFEIEAARLAIARLLPPHKLDVVVERVTGAVIPETGDMGFAHRKGLFSITVDPDNRAFAESLRTGSIRRAAAHEAHHCLRMAGPGYGTTLGDALVSEGLAGRFVGHLFGSPPEPWERAVGDADMHRHRPDAATLAATDYDHAAWFLGDAARPRWLGYSLAYKIVGEWLATAGAIDGQSWIDVPTAVVLTGSGYLAG